MVNPQRYYSAAAASNLPQTLPMVNPQRYYSAAAATWEMRMTRAKSPQNDELAEIVGQIIGDLSFEQAAIKIQHMVGREGIRALRSGKVGRESTVRTFAVGYSEQICELFGEQVADQFGKCDFESAADWLAAKAGFTKEPQVFVSHAEIDAAALEKAAMKALERLLLPALDAKDVSSYTSKMHPQLAEFFGRLNESLKPHGLHAFLPAEGDAEWEPPESEAEWERFIADGILNYEVMAPGTRSQLAPGDVQMSSYGWPGKNRLWIGLQRTSPLRLTWAEEDPARLADQLVEAVRNSTEKHLYNSDLDALDFAALLGLAPDMLPDAETLNTAVRILAYRWMLHARVQLDMARYHASRTETALSNDHSTKESGG
jgi:hypothetical protein